ncbi:MAG: putative zinc-binding protein [Desulfomonile sp.]|nr:putative zinc-binding protein [Desulfomonile sp.]
MSDECCTKNQDVMILACSGASNLGQLANQAAVELTREGFGKMFCVAAIGAHLPTFVEAAKKSEGLITVDGCAVGCARKILEHADVPLQAYVVLYDLGIEKNSNTNLIPSEVEKVKAAVKDSLKGRMTTVSVHAGKSRSCCG